MTPVATPEFKQKHVERLCVLSVENCVACNSSKGYERFPLVIEKQGQYSAVLHHTKFEEGHPSVANSLNQFSLRWLLVEQTAAELTNELKPPGGRMVIIIMCCQVDSDLR